MKDFKKMPKMACGGNVKKYAVGGDISMDDIMAARKSGQLKPVPMPAIERNENTIKPVPMPSGRGNPDGVDVPGIGRVKPNPMIKSRGDAMLLKKGGKATKKK